MKLLHMMPNVRNPAIGLQKVDVFQGYSDDPKNPIIFYNAGNSVVELPGVYSNGNSFYAYKSCLDFQMVHDPAKMKALGMHGRFYYGVYYVSAAFNNYYSGYAIKFFNRNYIYGQTNPTPSALELVYDTELDTMWFYINGKLADTQTNASTSGVVTTNKQYASSGSSGAATDNYWRDEYILFADKSENPPDRVGPMQCKTLIMSNVEQSGGMSVVGSSRTVAQELNDPSNGSGAAKQSYVLDDGRGIIAKAIIANEGGKCFGMTVELNHYKINAIDNVRSYLKVGEKEFSRVPDAVSGNRLDAPLRVLISPEENPKGDVRDLPINFGAKPGV